MLLYKRLTPLFPVNDNISVNVDYVYVAVYPSNNVFVILSYTYVKLLFSK